MHEWAYPVNENLDDVWGYDQDVEGFFRGRALSGIHKWHLSSGFRAITMGDRIWVYAVAPRRRIAAAGTFVSNPWQSEDDSEWYVDVRFDRELTLRLLDDPVPADVLEINVQSVRRLRPTESRRLAAHLTQPSPDVPEPTSRDSSAGVRPPDDEEMRLRGDPRKRARFERLLEGPHFMEVVAANRAYLAAAIADPERTEREQWALSCRADASTLSRLSMSGMETFTLAAPHEGRGVEGFVIVALSTLEVEFGTPERFAESFPDVDVEASNYRSAGDDQACVSGRVEDLVTALGRAPFAAAARSLAERLMRGNTSYKNGHNYWLADHVLGRAR